MAQLPRGTVTLLFSDVEGSTRLVRTLGPRYGEALADHRRLIRAAFSERGGVEVDTQGDSFLVAFARARDAVDAAAEAQRALAAHEWLEGEPLNARIGIHTGEPELAAGGYYVGLALNRGARICAAAHGGQVLLSQTTRNVVGDDIDAVDLGDYVLKGLPAPERLFQLVAPGLALDFPPLRAQRLGNLPSPRTPLVGREHEVEHVVALLGTSPIVTLSGPGGVGKTRLALEVARQAAGSFDDGAFFVPLASVDDPASVAAAITRVLAIAEEPRESAEAALERTLHDRTALVVLDSFEHVVPAATLVAHLVEACPRLKVLATSRERLRVAAETEYAVPPLEEAQAAALFTERAAAARPELELTLRREERERVLAICRRLEGLPLAIELAAARARLLPLASILERLEQRLSFLTGGPRDMPVRQQTLAATIDWSYALLDADEQRALADLAVFAGGFSLSAAAAILGDDELALRLLSSLRDKSLIVARAASDGGARFAMLDTIREYALTRLRVEEREPEVRELHAQYFARLAGRADQELRSMHQATWLGLLADDHENFQAALAWARAEGRDEALLELAGGLWRFWFSRGHVRDGRRWIEEALRRRQGRQLEPLARALFGASTLAVADGDLEAARIFAGERLEICRALSDEAGVASALSALANATAALGEYELARDLYEQAAERAESAGAWPELAMTMNNLGYLALLEADTASAIAHSTEARNRFRELNYDEDFAGAGLNVAMALLRERRPGEALPIVAESLAMYANLGHDDGVSYALDAVAAATVQLRADPRLGATLAGAARALRRRTGTTSPPFERAFHEGTLLELEANLGPKLVPALAEGESLSLDAAVACALKIVAEDAGGQKAHVDQ